MSRLIIAINDDRLASRLEALAQGSNTSVSAWVTEVLKDWIVEHRSGRHRMPDEHYDQRNDDTTSDFMV